MEFFNRGIRIREFSQLVSIGFYEVEKRRPQRVLIDVDLHLAPLAHEIPDEVSASVNYDRVHQAIPKLVAGRHFNLQERSATRSSRCARSSKAFAARACGCVSPTSTRTASAGYEAEVRVAGRAADA